MPPTRRDRSNQHFSEPSRVRRPVYAAFQQPGNAPNQTALRRGQVGYLGTRVNRENAYTVRPRPGAALRLAVPPITSFGVAINLIAANAPDSGHPYLGAVDAGQGNLGSVRGNSPPSSSAGTSLILRRHGGIESQIWTMNCQTREVTAQWTNVDGSQPSTTIFYDPVRNFLGLTGDLQAFNAAVSEGAFAVTMTFVPE
ncbi:hypothetical protein B0H13DRAFT_1865767 [Mycena leptocephala]|nr:hypothetical protein B0H13DRAFT_1865767 [Mycena leptocephala]